MFRFRVTFCSTQLLSSLLHRRSGRIIGTANTTSVPPKPRRIENVFISASEAQIPLSDNPVRDPDHYRDDSECGLCVFRVENTLFKVHRVVLSRDSSAFENMFNMPKGTGRGLDGTSDGAAVFLTDTVEQFRDLLWVLNAPPTDLLSGINLGRLLNIVEIANKYNFVSYSSWAVDQVYASAQDPTGPLCTASADICARILNVAILCDHEHLRDLMVDRLISQMLWNDLPPGPALDIAERHGLRKLQGVALYKQLVDMEQVIPRSSKRATQLFFPPKMDVEKRMHFLSAQHSLSNLWKCLRMTAPAFQSDGCPCHSTCISAWRAIWSEAAKAASAMRYESADVIGRLQSMEKRIRKLASNTPITLQCSLDAFEAVSAMIDDTVDGLMDHFESF